MKWLRKEVVGPGKITVISDQHLGIRRVFERPYFGWQESTGKVVHRYCTQHIAQNVYKDCHMKRVKTLFKQAARHKKSWRCEEYLKNNVFRIVRQLLVCAIVRICGTNVLSGSISVEKLQQLGKPKVWCSPKRSPN
jgi:hypothetical protein